MSTYSLERYRSFLRALKDRGSTFASFLDEPSETAVYLRHDVDFSLEFAHRLAVVNREEGVSATYFVLLRSHAYNLASDHSQAVLAKLRELGQRVGFHYSDLGSDGTVPLRDCVANDHRIASQLVAGLEQVWCAHSPSPTLLRACLELDTPGLVNASGERFMRGMTYYSDANMRYSPTTWLALAQRLEGPAHILIHPVYWIGAREGVVANLAEALGAVTRDAIREFELNARWADTFRGSVPAAVHALPAAIAEESTG
jgi:hypothetical protein